jgi:hypothetical protein
MNSLGSPIYTTIVRATSVCVVFLSISVLITTLSNPAFPAAWQLHQYEFLNRDIVQCLGYHMLAGAELVTHAIASFPFLPHIRRFRSTMITDYSR